LAAIGDIATEIGGGGITVSVVDPFTPAEAAWITEVPAPSAVTKPVASIMATVVLEDAQATEFVRFCVEPSL
jgi:hypothetical protein